MPKNKGKGGKNRRRGKNETEEKRELQKKDFGQEYAQVVRMMGNGRLEAVCFDGKKRLCHIRGKMRKRVWVNQGDIVLIGLRDFQDEKADVIRKYNAEEARRLKKLGELRADWDVDGGDEDRPKEEDVGFDFTGAGIRDSDEELEKVQDQPDRYKPLPEYDDESQESEEDEEEEGEESEDEEESESEEEQPPITANFNRNNNNVNHKYSKKDELDISVL